MLIGSKPLSEMSEEEMLAAIEELRSKREALRDEAIARKRVDAKAPRVVRDSRTKKEVDADIAAIYALFEEKE